MRREPAGINKTVRVADRDVKNGHEELSRLAQLGVIFFEEDGQRKRPVIWFDDLVISLPFEKSKVSDTASMAPSDTPQ